MRVVLAVAACGILLGACSEQAKETMGMRRTAPDEFAVVTRAPLSVPPDYTLRAPRPGADGPTYEAPVREVARQTVFGSNAATASNGQQAGDAFLSKVGPVDPNIRQAVDGENAEGVEESNKAVAEKLLFWKDDPANKGVTLDPVKEKERLSGTVSKPVQ